jgi:hypothetical protein
MYQTNSCLVMLFKINVLIWVQICKIFLQLIDYILLQLHKINGVGWYVSKSIHALSLVKINVLI